MLVAVAQGFGSLTMIFSFSYAGAIFADACLKGLNGVPDVVECSFVQSTVTELPFFASKVNFITGNGDAELITVNHCRLCYLTILFIASKIGFFLFQFYFCIFDS